MQKRITLKRLGAPLGVLAWLALLLVLWTGCTSKCSQAVVPEEIYYNGKIVTVDSAFSVAQAVAISGDRFLAVGTDQEVLRLAGQSTRKVNLEGRTVVPGLIEGHDHADGASVSELEEPIPDVHSLDELLGWIAEQASQKPKGAWIVHPKMFPTRLAELRQPTLAELDSVAPEHPVFLNGSYGGAINSAAMRASGISPTSSNPGILRDPKTGRPNGIIRREAFSLLSIPRRKPLSLAEHARALAAMYSRYNSVGFTSATDGGGSQQSIRLFQYMRRNGMLPVRVFLNIFVDFPFKDQPLEAIRRQVNNLGFSTGFGDEWIRIGALKITMDGGILTGTAYLREPWGTKAGEIFGITDPGYRGALVTTAAQFAPLVLAGAENGWKMTAHCAGGGGVDQMLDAYEEANRQVPVSPLRFSIIHGNFYTPQAAARCRALGVIADMQPAWFYKDADAMKLILGEERIKTFHPYRTLIEAGVVVSAGSDHMVKLDDVSSINPYNPWLAMWTMITRRTERGTVIVPEEAITREQALRCYTINNAFASFEERLKGSIEPGKLADMAVLESDYLTCPEDSIRTIKVKTTILGGKVVYER